jgi:hypothetical protein
MRFLLAAVILLSPVGTLAAPGTGSVGAGLMLGEPAGFSFKLFVDRHHAFDAGLSFSLLDNAFHAHADYLLHFPGKIRGLTKLKGGQWIPYAGMGGKLRFLDRKHTDARNGLSARIPVGIAFHPKGISLDFFLELVPGMKVLPETDPEFGGALGGRFYF